MGMRNTLKLAAASALVLGAAAVAQDKKNIIDQVMKKSMKGKTSLVKKAIDGGATDAEKKQLLDYVKQLAGTHAPVGDQAEWDKRIKVLIEATEEVAANKDGAPAKLKAAANCKSCHDAHKKD